MKLHTTIRRGCLMGALAVVMTGCQDPNLLPFRGYTKAPLDQPARIGGGERAGEMSRYGTPRRIETARLELPEQPDAPPAAAPVADVPLPEGVTQEMVALGDALFNGNGNCHACHGRAGTGAPLAPAVNDASWIHIDGSFDQLVSIIAQGVPQPAQYPAAMPPRGGAAIDDEQVRQIAAYVYAISRQ